MKIRHIAYLLIGSSLITGVTAPAFAQPESGASAGDIIVTARRVDERLQDVPISITVFNEEQIRNANIASARELSTYTPSLTTNSRFGDDYASFAIRGFTQEQRTTASVGVYFADVVAPRNGGSSSGGDGAGPGSMFDLQNAQVLKGPQGTLFGRNTTGGAVLLVPRKPTQEFEGYVEGTYGNYDAKRLQAVVNLPLSDTFRVRAGVDWQDRDGWQRNTSSVGPRRLADLKYVATRLSIVGDLTPNLENYTIASYSNSTPSGASPRVTDGFIGNRNWGTLAADQVEREKSAGLGRKSGSTWVPWQYQHIETWQIINTTTWQSSDALTIKNIISYAQSLQNQARDAFGLAVNLDETVRVTGNGLTGIGTGGTFNYPVPAQYRGGVIGFATSMSPREYNAGDQSTFTEELQFQGRSANGRMNWQAGAYYEMSAPLGWAGSQSMNTAYCPTQADWASFNCVDILPLILSNAGESPAVAARFGGSLNRQLAKISYRNVGLYAQSTFDLTEQLKLTGGFRYTWDKTWADVSVATVNYPASGGYITPAISCNNAALNDPGSNTVPTFDRCFENMRQSSNAPTWVVGLDYKLTPDVLLYAKWARGYRQGAVNPFAVTGFNSFEPETVDTYEAGFKTTFRGAVSGTFNVSAFYNDFRDMQLQVALADVNGIAPNLPPNVIIVNAGKARIYGAEVEATLNPFEGFNIQASYAYLNTKLTSFENPDLSNQPPGYYDLVASGPTVGQRLAFTPTHKFVLGATYRAPLDESVGRVTLGAIWTYTGSVYYGDVGSAASLIGGPTHVSALSALDDPRVAPGYSLVNFNLNWDNVMQSGFDAALFVTNAFDKEYYTDRSLGVSSGYVTRYLGQPRMYGARLRYNF
jgi:iron complex outermembrane recepter protein